MSKWVDIDDISLLKTVSVGGLSAKALWKRIRQQPSIDLVRCGECKQTVIAEHDIICNHLSGLVGLNVVVKPDDFCSYGERKESE